MESGAESRNVQEESAMQPAAWYEKRGGCATTRGQEYEVALCCLIYLRALRRATDFFFASNYNMAGKFDDAVLFYRLEGDQGHEYRAILVQAKHKENVTAEPLTSFFPFRLNEYLDSFTKIRNLWTESVIVGESEIKIQEITLVLYSNTGCVIGEAAVDVTDNLEAQHLRDFLNTGGRLLRIAEAERVRLPPGGETSNFLSHLILCTDQMSVDTADQFLKEELCSVLKLTSQDVLSKLTSELKRVVRAWWSQEGSVRYLTEGSDEWKKVLEMEISRLNGDTINIHRQLNVEFTEAALQQFEGVHRRVKMTWVCVRDEYQANAVRSRLFRAQRNSLVIGVKSLDDHLEEVEALWRNKICPTLVLDIVNVSPEEVSPLLKRLQEEVQSDAGRRLVVIAQGEPTSDEGWREVEAEPTWSVLQQVTRDRLLETPVRLQGETVALRDLVGSHVSDVMTDELINSVSVYEKTINLGTAMPEPLDYYVPRCLERKASKKITYKSYQHTKSLLFSNSYYFPLNDFTKGIKTLRLSDIDRRNQIMHTTFVEGISDDSDIRRLCCTLRVPGLRGETGLEDSAGEVTEFIPFTWTSEEKIVVIEGPPGVGKSSFVTMMCHTVKEQFSGAWALRLDMGKLTEYIKEIDFTEITDIKELLMKSLSKEPNNLERQLLEHSLTVTGNVFLFLDAFDEVSPDYTRQCCDLLRDIARMMRYRQMVVTTRPVTTRDVEEALGTKAFTLPVFNQEEQGLFLKQFITSKGKHVGEEEISILRESAGPVLEIPLLCRMVSDVLLHRRDQPLLKYQNPWRRVLLFDVFVEESIKQSVVEKLELNISRPGLKTFLESNKKQHLQNLQGLAVRKLMPVSRLPSLSVSTITPEEKLGLVVNTGGRVDFEHQTFAEYFLGCWLACHWQKCPRKLLRDVLFRDGFEFVAATFSWSLFADGYPLHLAVAQGNEDLVREHLAPGTTTTDRGGRSALHVAAITQGEHHKVWELLVTSGEDLNREDDVLGATAVKYAEISDNWEFVESFLVKEETFGKRKYNSKENTAMKVLNYITEKDHTSLCQYILRTKKSYVYNFDDTGNTLLHLAAAKNSRGVMQVLINKSRKLNVKNKSGFTPLHEAARQGHVEAVKLLAENGANLNIKTDQGNTALAEAARKGHFDVVKLLLGKGADVNKKNDDGNTALSRAATDGHLEMVKLLLEEGSDLNKKNDEGNTALSCAATEGHLEIVKLLLDKGSDLNKKNNYGNTALSSAAVKGNLEMVKLLLDKGAHLNIKTEHGNTALWWAACKGHIEVVKFLLLKGADVNKINKYGNTALSWAASKGHLEMVKLLLEKGSDINIKTNDGNTALSCAVSKGHLEVVRLLKQYKYKNINNEYSNKELVETASKGHLEGVKLLLQEGSDFNVKNDYGNTALSCAAINGHLEVVKLLLEKGSDLNIKNNQGDTALSWAARKGHLEVVKLLLQKGSDFSIKSDQGNTALSWAAREGHLEVVKLLLVKGSDLNIKNNQGNTALSWAARKGHFDVVKLLSEKGSDLNIKTDQGNTAVSWAARKGHLEVVKLLLREGSNLKVKNDYGDTALSQAAINGHLDVVKLLLEKGSDLNMKADHGITALSWAARKGHLEIVKLLLEKGSDLNIKNNLGNTALSLAAINGHLEVVKLLLEKGSDLNIKTDQGLTALSWAANQGHLEVVKFLLDKGADINIKDDYGNTELVEASSNGHIEVVKLLLEKGSDLNIRDNQGDTALSRAAISGHLEVVKLLLEKGSDLNMKTDQGSTALAWAAYNGHLKVVKFLLDKGADINIKDDYGNTELADSSSKGHLDVVKLLLEKGSDLNIKNNRGNTALSFAAIYGHLEVVKLLLEKGSDLNIKNNWGNTALSLAAINGHLEVVKLLLEKGSGLNIKTDQGLTALSWAARKGHLEVVKFLLDKGADINIKNDYGNAALSLAAINGHLEVVKLLLEKGSDLNIKDNKGNTALSRAAIYGHLEVVKLLLEKGFKLNIKTGQGLTALSWAANKGHLEVVKFLLDKGADINIKNDNGNTELLEASSNGHIEVVKLLLEKGSDLNIKNNWGYTALLWAAREGHLDVVKLLIEKGADVNIKDNDGDTAMSLASREGRAEVVTFFTALK